MTKFSKQNSVSSFSIRIQNVISCLHSVVCGRRPLLHGLKEAPELFRMAIPFTGANLVTRRVTESVAEVISSLLIYGASGPPYLAGFNPFSRYLMISVRFTRRAAACIAVRLCCRVAVNLHQTRASL